MTAKCEIPEYVYCPFTRDVRWSIRASALVVSAAGILVSVFGELPAVTLFMSVLLPLALLPIEIAIAQFRASRRETFQHGHAIEGTVVEKGTTPMGPLYHVTMQYTAHGVTIAARSFVLYRQWLRLHKSDRRDLKVRPNRARVWVLAHDE